MEAGDGTRAFYEALSGGKWFWLSFADPDRPEGQRWLGGAMVPALDIVDAVSAACAAGINPGGEVLGVGPLPACPEGFAWRLVTDPQEAASMPAPEPESEEP